MASDLLQRINRLNRIGLGKIIKREELDLGYWPLREDISEHVIENEVENMSTEELIEIARTFNELSSLFSLQSYVVTFVLRELVYRALGRHLKKYKPDPVAEAYFDELINSEREIFAFVTTIITNLVRDGITMFKDDYIPKVYVKLRDKLKRMSPSYETFKEYHEKEVAYDVFNTLYHALNTIFKNAQYEPWIPYSFSKHTGDEDVNKNIFKMTNDSFWSHIPEEYMKYVSFLCPLAKYILDRKDVFVSSIIVRNIFLAGERNLSKDVYIAAVEQMYKHACSK